MTSPRACAVALLLLFAAGSACARPHSVDPMDWLIQHVCVDSAGRPITADPYGGCGAGSLERRLLLDDPLPYLRHDQPGKGGDHPNGFQRLDSHPILDVNKNTIVSANDFDFDYFEPYGPMHPGDGLGFGCGGEPLPSLFAKYGVKVLATDLDPNRHESEIWRVSGQHSATVEEFRRRDICPEKQLLANIGFRPIDMNELPRANSTGRLISVGPHAPSNISAASS